MPNIYTPIGQRITWEGFKTPLNDSNLNNIEERIQTISEYLKNSQESGMVIGKGTIIGDHARGLSEDTYLSIQDGDIDIAKFDATNIKLFTVGTDPSLVTVHMGTSDTDSSKITFNTSVAMTKAELTNSLKIGGTELDETKLQTLISEYINKNKLGSAFRISSDGYLNLVSASNVQIQNQMSYRMPITPHNLSYAVKVALTANTETLTNEEKDAARNWLGISTEKEITDYIDKEIAEFDFVKVVEELPEEGLPNREYFVRKGNPDTNDLFDEYAWINKGTEEEPDWGWEFKGTKTMEIDLSEYINKNNLGSAFRISSDGYLNLVSASNVQIQNQMSYRMPITPHNLSYAVKVGLTANTETLTNEEKAAVCAWIGANPSGGYTVHIECEPNRAPIYISKHFPTSPDDYDAVLPKSMFEDDENQYLTLTDVKQLWFWDAESLPGLCATSNGRYLFYNYYTDYCGFDSSEYDEATGGDVKAVYKNTFRVFEDMTVYITHIYE